MKHTRLYSCLLAVVMLVMASATALAQEFAYTAKSATFLKSGEKGTVSVSFSNSEKVRILEGKIKLPAELSFVVKNAEKLWYRCLYYMQTNRWSVLFQMRDMILEIGHREAKILEKVVAKLEDD